MFPAHPRRAAPSLPSFAGGPSTWPRRDPAGREPSTLFTLVAVPSTRLVLEYDGTLFSGWARQPGRRTVQEVLERALALVRGVPTPLTVAGRTDAGAHALAQVASYAGESVHAEALNAVLPADVAVIRCEAAPDTFDARADATSRAYVYRVLARRERSALWAGRAVWWPRPLDRGALDACAAALPGRHDFTAFTPNETEHNRFDREVLGACWRDGGEEGLLELWIEADSFLRHMCRVLVGTMLEVAGGRRAPADFEGLLAGAPRRAAGETAPAHGLYLVGIGFDAPVLDWAALA